MHLSGNFQKVMQVAVGRVAFHADIKDHGLDDTLTEDQGAVEGAQFCAVKTVVNERSGLHPLSFLP